MPWSVTYMPAARGFAEPFTSGSGAPPSKMFLLGRVTYPYSSQFADGTVDERWNGSAWSATTVTGIGVSGTVVLASCCYDPATKLAFMFGDWDFRSLAYVYDTVADTYTQITNMPATVGGNDTFAAVYNGNCFIFSGGIGDNPGGFPTAYNFSNAIIKYPINASALSQSYVTTSAVTAYAAKDIFGAVDSQNPNICYFGGGNQDVNDPPTVSNTNQSGWFKYDMSTPNTNPVAMASMPDARAMAACVDVGSEIFVIGGSPNGVANTVGTSVVRAYNKAGNTWRTLSTAYPEAVASARATYFNGVIYCAGGWNTSSGFVITDNPPQATKNVYKSSDLGASWQLHSTLTYAASGGSLLIAA